MESVEVWPAFDYSPGIVPAVMSLPGGPNLGPTPSREVSELLLHWGNGDRKALEAILPLVYNELRRLARANLRQQRPNHTLQTTALVHEAYLRLAGEKSVHVENRAHFLGIAAQLMRWILVDYERNRRASKRGAGLTRLSLHEGIASPQRDVDLLALDEASSCAISAGFPLKIRRSFWEFLLPR
jgi:RNA polymerase sigma factor (TIGR02999 family)